MFFQKTAILALATGLAAALPAEKHARVAEPLPDYKQTTPAKRGVGNVLNVGGGNNGLGDNFNFGNAFNQFNNQEQVVQIKKEQLQIVDNGRQEAVVQQAEQVVVVDQRNNRGFNDLFRKSFYRNKFQDVSTVMLVVQEIQVAVDDGRGGLFQQKVFAQSAVVANRGRRQSQTLMIFDERQLVATQVLGGLGQGIAGVGAAGAQATEAPVAVGGGNGTAGATQTNAVQLLGSKPTWSQVGEDPAATMAAQMQAELQDAQNAQNNNGDNNANAQAAQLEKQQLDQAGQQQGQQQQAQDANKQVAADGSAASAGEKSSDGVASGGKA